MKKILFTIILSSFLLDITAQNSVIHLPDSLGKYLFESFINKADLSKSEVSFVSSYSFNPEDMWPNLLNYVDGAYINSQTVKYYDTFFRRELDSWDLFPTELYVSMKQEDKIYAFCVNVSWNGKRWLIEKVDTDFYEYIETGKAEPGFRNITNNTIAGIYPEFKFNADFKSTVNISQPNKIHIPDSFSDKVLELVSDKSPYGNNEIFFTKQEYMETEGARTIKMIDKLLQSGTDIESDKEKIMTIYNNPDLLYGDLVDNWNRLQRRLKKKFGKHIKDFYIQHVKMDISNWNIEKGIIENPALSATINISLCYQDKNAGIHFSAIWYNGMWKLSHIQNFVPGIDSDE